MRNRDPKDIRWLADLVNRHFIKVNSVVLDLNEWVKITDLHESVIDVAKRHGDLDEKNRPKVLLDGFYIDITTRCGDDRSHCPRTGVSYFNTSRELQYLLSLPPESTEEIQVREELETKLPPTQKQFIPNVAHRERRDRLAKRHSRPRPLKDRIAIHVRLGDDPTLLTSEEYLQIYESLRLQHQFNPGRSSIHFVYRLTKNNFERDQARISTLHEDFPNAQVHNIKDVEDTVRFLATSKFLVTSGSGISFLAAYFCPNCHVVFTTPELHKNPNTSKDYFRNIYYMDEWVPVHQYIGKG